MTNSPEQKQQFEKYLEHKITFTCLGRVTSGKIVIDDVDFGSILNVKEDYLTSIEKLLES